MTRDSRSLLRRAALVFVPLAVVASGMAGTIYVVAQQQIRADANSPQVQLAEDAARALDGGTTPATVTDGPKVDVAGSLAPFVAVFDQQGNALASTGQLDGAAPVPPKGVLQAATAAAPNRVTWQPRPGVRIATVTVPWSGGTVMAGRSLHEAERATDLMLSLVVAGWAVTLVVLAVTSGAVAWLWPHASLEATPA